MYVKLLAKVSLTVAESRHQSETLLEIVNGLVNEVGFALARIWLILPDDPQTLQLKASAGRSIVRRGEEWTRLDGRFSRFALGSRKVGRTGSTGESVLLEDVTAEGAWIADPGWAAAEKMRSFAAHPLVFKGEILGVLGVFHRERLTQEQLAGLRPFADHAAVSLANARAFEELQAMRSQLELEKSYLQEEVREGFAYHDIVGSSGSLVRILQQVEIVAPTDASVLILGESGTGKELIARAIHDRSRRHSRTLVKVNCASVPRELFESEFFGHARGSFTGAIKDRIGRFQLADQGTLFLDEVGEIPLDLQSKLLRVLQEGEFERIGEDHTRRVNVRVIAATNRELGKESADKKFREDLYYRLSVFPIVVPALRERKEDIPALAGHFIRHSARRMGMEEPALTGKHVQALMAYDWPGNIRELQHVVERAVILGRGQSLVLDLPAGGKSAPAEPTPAPALDTILTASEFKQLEIANLKKALAKAGGQIHGSGGAAALLGIPGTTLASRLKALGIVWTKNC